MYTFEMYNNSAIDINRYQESTGRKNQIKKIYLANYSSRSFNLKSLDI